jgi:hypothetical protein
MSSTTTPAPIMVGSEVTPKRRALALVNNATKRTLKEGEKYTVACLGGAFAILTQAGSEVRLLAEVADLRVW